MKIISASVSHVSALVQLDHSRSYSAHWTSAQWQAEFGSNASCVWAAFAGQILVGFICIRGAAGMYEITNLAVAQAYSRRGIATELLAQAMQMLQTLGAEQVTLEVSVKNVPAQGLYQRAGFVTLGTRKQFYPDGTDALIMGKKL